MNINDLKTELDSDPLTRAYSGMSDVNVAADMNSKYRLRNRTSMSGTEVLNALDKAEYLALTDAEKQRLWAVLHLGTINPFGVEADIIVDIFLGGAASVISLQAARQEAISRGVELGLGEVKAGHVQMARAL